MYSCRCCKELKITDSHEEIGHIPRLPLLRRLYRWTLSWAAHPHAQIALFIIAMIEASVFPIPPDVLLIAMALARPESGLRLALVATAGSTFGAVIGYLIGMLLFAAVAEPVLSFYGAMDTFSSVQGYFTEWGVWFVMIAGFSPIPFKVITIAAGAFDFAFLPFILAAMVSRAARFGMEGALLRWGGNYMRELVEKYFEWITVLVVILVAIGFAGLWYMR